MSLPPARRRGRPVTAAVVAAVLLAPAGAASASPAPGRDGAGGRPGGVGAGWAEAEQAGGEGADDEVARLLARAAELRDGVRRRAASVPEAVAAVDAAAADSGLALSGYRAAAQARRAAAVELDRRERELAGAEAEVARQRAETTRWVRARYAEGAVPAGSPALAAVLSGGSPDDVLTRRVWVERDAARRALAAGRLSGALARSREAASAAQRASAAADAAAARAGQAARVRDVVLAAQRARLVDLREALAAAAGDARALEVQAARIAGDSLDAARWSADLPSPGPGGTGPVGDCRGGDVAGYGNGRIPLAALCPVTGAAGEFLRADAAYAFDRLTAAFAARFGRRLCVTDAYRSYDDQVRVRAERPGYAAVPGTSNHGWGTATDLCGGVDRFGTPEHTWMRRNAPLFGWFHPPWAHADGSTPEPWHWEFSG